MVQIFCIWISHYVLVKRHSHLIKQRSTSQAFPSVYCLHVFCRADLLAQHMQPCKPHGPHGPHGPQRGKMPSGNDAIQRLRRNENQLRAPFIICADFECHTKPIDPSAPCNMTPLQVSHDTSPGVIQTSHDARCHMKVWLE